LITPGSTRRRQEVEYQELRDLDVEYQELRDLDVEYHELRDDDSTGGGAVDARSGGDSFHSCSFL
jgi:hypothetical protein